MHLRSSLRSLRSVAGRLATRAAEVLCETAPAASAAAFTTVGCDDGAHVPSVELVSLRAQHQLIVERTANADAISLVSGDGAIRLRIAISNAGSEIIVEATNLAVRATGDLAIEADRVALHARKALSLTTGLGATITMDENLRANGERIYLNS